MLVSPHLKSFSQIVVLGKDIEQSIHGGVSKQDESRWKILRKMGNVGDIVQEDNSAEQCFVLRDLESIKSTLVKLSRFWLLVFYKNMLW